MEFSPSNPVVKLCLQGMAMEEQGQTGEARRIFLRAWEDAENNFEKYLAAYYVARTQNNAADSLKWLKNCLDLALEINDHSVKAAYPLLYQAISRYYEMLDDPENAKKYQDSANSCAQYPDDSGPFYHGTKADLKEGDLLIPGFNSNYKPELSMNHIYFTALRNGAGLAAALAKGDGAERVYIVEPTGNFENDPNLTNKKFPGNPTRSYRTSAPLKIVGEITDWSKQSEQDRRQWRDKLSKNKGEIIN